MEITDRGIARIVSDETLVPAQIADQGCDILRIITTLEGVQPTRRQIFAAAAIRAAARPYDDQFDNCSLDKAKFAGSKMSEILKGRKAHISVPPGLTKSLTIAAENAEASTLEAFLALT